MSDSRKITALIVKLIRGTVEGSIIWQPSDTAIQLSGGASLLNKVYTTVFKERYFRIYQFRVRHYHDEDTFSWVEKVQLDLTDQSFNTEWSFPEEQAVRDLYDTVRFKVAGVSQLLDDILEDEDIVEDNELHF